MNWLVFSYSLPSGPTSSSRVSIWRRLNRIGAVTPKAGVSILPEREDCLEAFQWLAQEVEQAKGEAFLMKVEKFEGMEDREIIRLFQTARDKDYEKIEKEIKSLRRQFQKEKKQKRARFFFEKVKRLHDKMADIEKIDYYASHLGKTVSQKLLEFEKELKPIEVHPSLPRYKPEAYRGKVWVTRPKPHVDRLGCIWLIRRFIDPKARIKYAASPQKGQIPFDMKGALFGHQQDSCSFETMVRIFGLQDKALEVISELIHEIDLRDSRHHHCETEGVAAILKGWLLQGLSDRELESRGIQLFEGLYQAFKKAPGV